MSKNEPSFSESLKTVETVSEKRPTRLGTILNTLRQEGNSIEADAIENALRDEELPLYRVYKALLNSGYEVSYSAVTSARRRILQNA